MQGKSLIKFFFAALILVSIYQLSFTWVASKEDKKAEAYATSNVPSDLSGDARTNYISDRRSQYFTEHADDKVYNIGIAKYNYDEVKKRSLSLGLDLQGGMSVVLEVSKYDLVKSLCNNPKDPTLNKALDMARDEEAKGNGELIDLFQKYYEAQNPNGNLVTLFQTKDNRDDLPATSTNAEVIDYLKTQADAGVTSTYTKLKQRIDKFGVSQPSVTLQKSTGRIVVELPGVDNPQRARELLQATANLEFWRVWHYEGSDNMHHIVDQADAVLKTMAPVDTSMKNSGMDSIMGMTMNADTSHAAESSEKDTSMEAILGSDSDTSNAVNPEEEGTAQGPLESIMLPPSNPAAIGSVDEKDTAQVMQYLRMDAVQALFPSNTKLLLAALPNKGTKTYEVYAIKTKVGDPSPLLDGSVIKSAHADRNQLTNQIEVEMSMNSEGARDWARITEEAAQANKDFIAIVLDNRVYSAPSVNEPIRTGTSSITGDFDQEEATLLANILEVGKLPVPSHIVQEDIVGPSLGAESIRTGLIAMVAGLLLVILFMIFYYSTSGLIADLALFANIFFIFGVLASIGATLTLPGIAGIVLTMGMAVDANVIIYERIREELAKGKSMIKAIADGYSNSYSAIIDSNITTLIIGIILVQFGEGTVKGFAVVLIIGIISSLFTSIFISRLILDFMARKERKVSYYTQLTKSAFKNVNLNMIGKRRFGYIFSGSLMIIGVIFMLTTGFHEGVEFKGGRAYTVRFDHPINAEDVRTYLSKNLDAGIQVKTFSGNDKLKITTSYLIDSPDPKADSLAAVGLYNKLTNFYTTHPDFQTWDDTYKESQMKVEPTIASDIKNSAEKALVFALISIFIYIVIRFRRWQFGVGAVVSLIHDAFMTLAMFSILKDVMPFSLQIDESFVAAILTVIGYSINDTVVVFDRIREYIRESRSGTIPQIFNAAINQTLSRTVITSGTTLLSVVVLLLFGNENIQGFAFALFIGIGFGTYSSVFIASAIAVDTYKKEHHTKQAEVVMR